MEFSSFWRFSLLTIFISIYLVNYGKCDCGSGIKECQYREWSSWGSCNKSVQTTKRIRPICCPPVIKIYDACLKHCNITTNILQTSEERNCIAIFKKNNSKCRQNDRKEMEPFMCCLTHSQLQHICMQLHKCINLAKHVHFVVKN